MSNTTLIEILSARFQQKRKDHPSFRLLDIDDSLFPNGIVTFETEVRDSDNRLKTVKDIIAESWKKGEKNHLMIQGEGGIGKTVTLLNIPDKFTPCPVPAIYIPLYELNRENEPIEHYIKSRILNKDNGMYGQLLDLIDQQWDNRPQLLLLLDGFNEIPYGLRGVISKDIDQWSEYPGVQIITSSRYDIHQYVFLGFSFSIIELLPLSEDTVLRYLERNDIDVPQNSTVTKLITIPLLLTLYIKTKTIGKERLAPYARFLKANNAGTLIWNYLQCELWRFRNNSREGALCVLAMEFVAPYVAWTMQQNSEFVVNESSFLDRIDEACELMKNHINNKGVFPEHIKITLQQSTVLPDNVSISKLLKESLCLFIGNEGNYRLVHQQFRDALAAIHLINSVYLYGNSRPKEWDIPVDYYVMQFVADLISEDDANRLWEQNRTSLQLESATRNQLELQKRLHNCDFSKLNFSGLDLRAVSLYPYRVGNALLKLPTDADTMKDVKFSEKTFSAEGHSGPVDAVTVTKDGSRIVSGSSDNNVRIWKLESGDCIKTLVGHDDSVNAVAVTPDNKLVVSGSRDKTIRVWDMENGSSIITLEGHKDIVDTVNVTPDGRCIISGARDNTIRIWDLETGTCLKTLEGHIGCVTAVAITPDGKRIVSGSSDSTIRIWDLETGSPIGKPIEGHEDYVTAVAVTSDGKRIVSGSSDSTIRVWDLETGSPIGKPIEGHEDYVTAVAVTSDGKRIVSGSSDSTIRVWDLGTGSPIGKPIEGHRGAVYAVAVTADNKRIVSGSWDNTIRVWDMEIGACINTLERSRNWLPTVAVTPDGKYIISGSFDRTILIWDVKNSQCIRTLGVHEDLITVVVMTPDGKRIISGSADCTIRIWDMENGACLNTLKGHEGEVNTIAVTPDGKRIVSGSADCTIRIWDMENGACLNTLKGHEGEVNAVAVTPDGRYIVSGSDDKTILIWNLDNGECGLKLIGHNYGVNTIELTKDGNCIVSSSYDKTIRVWDIKSGECLETLAGQQQIGDVKTLTPDEKFVVYGFSNGTIRIENREINTVKTIRILPLTVIGLDFSKALFTTPELKEQLRQNGAKV